jgi:fructose-1,6-bisphosphatase II
MRDDGFVKPGCPEVEGSDYDLGLKLVQITELAALEAGRWLSLGNQTRASQAAAQVMGQQLAAIKLNNLVFQGLPGATSVLAMVGRGSVFSPGPVSFMQKLAVGPTGRGAIDLNAPLSQNLHNLADKLKRPISALRVAVLNQPGNQALIETIRAEGAQLHLMEQSELNCSFRVGFSGYGLDLLVGTGGAIEGILIACALKCLGGEMQARLVPQDAAEFAQAQAAGIDLEHIYTENELVTGEDIFLAATGITTGSLLEGVTYSGQGARTDSLLLSTVNTTTRKHIQTTHRWNRLLQLA